MFYWFFPANFADYADKYVLFCGICEICGNVLMENCSSNSSPDRKGKPGEGNVRWGCAVLGLNSGTDA